MGSLILALGLCQEGLVRWAGEAMQRPWLGYDGRARS